MFQNELNYALTAFTVGYIIGEVPSNILLTRIRPSIYIPAMQVQCDPDVSRFWLHAKVHALTGSRVDCLDSPYLLSSRNQEHYAALCAALLPRFVSYTSTPLPDGPD